MRTGSVSLAQFLTVWILSVAVGAIAVLAFGLPGLVVLGALMVAAHLGLNRRVGPTSGPELPRGPGPD